MKTLFLMTACLLAPLAALAQAVNHDAPKASDADLSRPSLPQTPPGLREQAWQQVRDAIAAPADEALTLADALNIADRAKGFYTEFPQDPNASEARKLEALYLIEAAGGDDDATKARMLSSIQSFRSDQSVPAYERAIVAGTYEFIAVGRRVRSPGDLQREYQGVARSLIREFPDQPQGYITLLTEAGLVDDQSARAMAQEIVNASAAPSSARQAANGLLARLNSVGKPIDTLLDETVLKAGQKGGWRQNRPGVLYVWATWSVDSIAWGEKLKARLPADANILSICLDVPDEPLELGTLTPRSSAIAALADKLPGRVVQLPGGPENEFAVRLGANAVPLLYLVGADGRVTDVRGVENLEAKLNALGL